ncbi:protein-glutamate O-methyltransferase CheR [Thiotrichales bacterium 19X7-9]|nr:protein-glutamate O-methyltransferase CheR [Thiotrichales bacterium 19X7-9]
MTKKKDLELENIQIDLLLEAITRRYDYNFKDYAKASLKRRLEEFINKHQLASYYQLIEYVLEDQSIFEQLLNYLSVTVTSMFRDPIFFDHLREKVIPIFRTYPSIKIWHAGCATGEEVYSLAILLYEEGLLDRCRIYATDINMQSLQYAKEGIYPVNKIKEFTQNYNQSSGKNKFSDYYHVKYDSAVMEQILKEHMIFSQHNLACDGPFGSFNLVLCRNVLIYFNQPLQNKVLQLINNSLDFYSIFCLGMKETLSCSEIENQYQLLERKTKIYQKVVA